MAVNVRTTNDVTEHIPQGVKWHIDEERKLHVKAEDGRHVAAFQDEEWAYIIEEPALDKPDVVMLGLERRHAQSAKSA